MVTSAKTPAKPAAKSAAKPAVKPVAKPAASPAKKSAATAAAKMPAKTPARAASAGKSASGAVPTLRFQHSQALRERTDAVLDALDADPSHPDHGEAIADLTTALIDAGMDDYFLRALKDAKVGFVTEQSARVGIVGAVRLISSISRKYIVRMDGDQLLAVSRHIRSLRG